jgi:cysteine desulfurase/selenocysteine lyase
MPVVTSPQHLRDEILPPAQVPLADGSFCTPVRLDNAATTPPFRGVQRKVNEFLPWYASIHRGCGFQSLLSTHVYEQARAAVAGFVGADPEVDCVIFCRNATEAINKLAGRMAFGPDDVVLTTVMEHHSNDLPWRGRAHVVYAGLCDDGSLDVDDLACKLARHQGRVKLVAVTGASNVTGFLPPIGDIAELAHRYGAQILVDGAQLVPHRRLCMGPAGSARHLDFVALSAHKMYAPLGVGALVGPREFFLQGPPDQRGGGTIEIVTLDEVHWAAPPERDEAGTPNVVGAVALAASIRILESVGMETIAAHERALTRYALQRLREVTGVQVAGSSDPDRLDDRLGVISFQVAGVPHALVAAILAFEHGISVRNGCFCAHPYVLRLLGIGDEDYRGYRGRVLAGDRSQLPGLVRASLGCYNTREDVDRLVEALARIAAGDYRCTYSVEKATGMYCPTGFDQACFARHFSL